MTQQVTHRCPSNIALIKYWGKRGNQLPENPSLSFTLSESFTEMQISYQIRENQDAIQTEFLFENAPNEKFKAKIDAFLENQSVFMKCLELVTDHKALEMRLEVNVVF